MNIKKSAYDKIKSYYTLLSSSEGMELSEIEQKNYNYEFTVKNTGSEKVKVQVYFGKKGVRTVVQGNKESTFFKEIEELISGEPAFSFPKNDLSEPEEYIGTDETGKGDFFGPLVVAAVYVDRTSQKVFRKLGVRDSKSLRDNQIIKIASEIITRFPEDFEIAFIPPKKYNELYESFGNLNKLLDWAHSKAIENLLKRKKCNIVITDKFSKTDLGISGLIENSHIEFHTITKAEKYTGVAAASILARAQMVDWFSHQASKGIVLPKGSSNNIEETANMIIEKYGKEKLRELAKLHFKTTKRLNN